ncbi:MAG: hypothetical protein ACKOGA_10695, partial [Planctomycetaceae bacterium]
MKFSESSDRYRYAECIAPLGLPGPADGSLGGHNSLNHPADPTDPVNMRMESLLKGLFAFSAAMLCFGWGLLTH